MITVSYIVGLFSIVVMIAAFCLHGDYDFLTHQTMPNPWQLPMIILSIAGLNGAFILWAVGKIVLALWHLPGRE